MPLIIGALALFFPVFVFADFSISISIDEPTSISSTLSLKGKSCKGMNQKTEIKYAKKVCDQVFSKYKDVLSSEPDTLPPADDEPTASVKFTSGARNWSRTIGRVSGDTPENKKIKALTNEILKLNAQQ